MKKNKKDCNKYVSDKNYKLNIKWILCIFLVILIISLAYVKNIKDLAYQNVYNNITELSEQTVAQLNLAIKNQEMFVDTIIEIIDGEDFNTVDEIFTLFKEDIEKHRFTRLVILDEMGNGITSDGHIVKQYPNIQEFFSEDKVYLSENRPSTVSDNQVNIYSRTFKFKNKKLVLFATINTENYREILLRRLFNGKGGTYLINNDGEVLIDSSDTIKENNVELYEFIKNNYNLTSHKDISKIYNMAKDIKELKVGTFHVNSGQNTYFMHYEKINVNNWYVVTVAPDTTIAKELITFISISLGACFLINFIIVSISIYIDISNQSKNEKLYKIAYIDSITTLGNEAYFREKSSIFLQEQMENKYIITIDINKFRALNKIHGYEFCNGILKELGKKLLDVLPTENITCRISNDIFAAIFIYEQDIRNLLDEISLEVSSLKVEDKFIYVNLSIGAYKISKEDQDINNILNKSYMARSRIKGLYNENYYIFDEILENTLIEEQHIESCMENALKNKEFKVVYQPKVSTNDEKLIGAEALVRWEKDGMIISPGKFIPLFEKNKFINKLDLYIFEQVCKDIESWKKKYNFETIISINVSKEHFLNENFIDEYVKISNKYNINRNKIDLEITESATIDENIDTLKILNNIKSQGFNISIDDFGTGYSSLSMLQNMPIDVIKIDKVFVDKADLNSNNNIINYIMLLAKRLGVKTVVEGVETVEQVEFIRKLKCDVIQGYYYSKPICLSKFEEYFNNYNKSK